MTQYTAKKAYIKNADGDYIVPYVNPADDTNLGVVKVDNDTLASDNGKISIKSNNQMLHALKSYADKGELLTDAEGLADVKDYAHSTFDASKFTVVGSPVITDDGIVSGFTARTNYLYFPLNLGGVNDWEFELEFTCWSGSVIPFCYTQNLTSPFNEMMRLQQNAAGTQKYLVLGNAIYSGFDVLMTAGNTYKFNLKFDGTKITVKHYDNNNTLLSSKDVTTTAFANNGYLVLGGTIGGNTAFDGSINLKSVFVKIDGVEVLSGNKTGIDTIKADDYTVVGSPTISDDGIASGFSSSNYLKTITFQPTATQSWKIECVVTTGAVTDTQGGRYILGYAGSAGNSAILFQSYQNRLGIYLKTANGGSNILSINAENLTPNTKYKFELSCDGSLTYTGKILDMNGVVLNSDTKSVVEAVSFPNTLLSLGYNGWSYFTGSIDLNAFKIYVDGNLVYQPCLKIPYAESKTGSKIVDSIYRDRVNDMAEQFGYANYYTLDEDNGNFTLPQVELYGLIGQRTLRDSYRNGINYWELYSNRDLEQGGSCTSGVEVTFARPFADTNYVLSVPYSAKSTTAFTPTQTGDWIAKGKGIL